MTKTLLWLDDVRDPHNKKIDWLVFSPIGKNVDIHWVTNYMEFIDWIMIHGLPDAICFDHDLADEHYRPSMYNPDGHYSKYYNDGTFKEKTGYDCAKWLIDYCDVNNLELPKYNIQSANPVGKQNIDVLLKNYIKFKEQNLVD